MRINGIVTAPQAGDAELPPGRTTISFSSMYKQIPVADLDIGMFVADIDRPWIDTPFLLQGFLIEDSEQIAQLRKYCQMVTIDGLRSVGDHHVGPPKPVRPAPGRNGEAGEPRIIVERKTAPSAPTAAPPKANTPAVPAATPPAAGKATPRQQTDGLLINTSDAEFRPTESGRYVLTPKPRVEDGNLVEPVSSTGKRSIWNAMGSLGQFVKDAFASKPRENFDDGAHAPDTGAGALPAARPNFIPETVHLVVYEETHSVEEERGPAEVALDRTNELLHRMAEDIRVGGTLAIAEVEEVISDMVDSMVRNPDALMWVMRLREQDSTTYGHALYASVYLLALGRHLGYPKDYLARLGSIGLLLDVGKMRLPKALLEKSERLSSEEYETIKGHVRHSLDIVGESSTLHPDITEGIAQHHERENGSGYPAALKGGEISTFGRMAAIADCFAALTNQRPYAEAVSAYDALRSLSGWGGEYFHAPIVEQFIQAIGVFPVGSLVELSTGEVAVVISHNKTRRLKPRVLVITGPDHTPSPHPAMMDLLYAPAAPGGGVVHIRRGLAAGAFGLDAREYYVT